jgi:hypothetical protein
MKTIELEENMAAIVIDCTKGDSYDGTLYVVSGDERNEGNEAAKLADQVLDAFKNSCEPDGEGDEGCTGMVIPLEYKD